MGILVVGSVAIDDVITPSGKNFNAPGGSATYFSLSASYFSDVKIVAVVGEDFPKEHIELLNKRGINTGALKIEKGETFRWKGTYEKDLNNPKTLATHLNLFENFAPKIPDTHKNEDIVFLANIDPELQLNILEQTNTPKLTAADTMNLWIDTKRDKLLKVLEQIDIIFINEHEARQLTNRSNLIKAGKEILSYGPRIVLIKKGENGVITISKDNIFLCPAYPVENVFDPTGAGDTFAGGFLGSLAKFGEMNDEILRISVIYGTIMASFSVEDFDIKALKNLDDKILQERFKSFKGFCV